MRNRAIILGLIVAGFVGWKVLYPTYSYRFLMTVEINTPEGVKSGSSVIEVATIQYPRWITLGANAENSHIKGESVTVDMGGGKYLFTVLQNNTDVLAPRTFLNAEFHARPTSAHAKKLSGMVGRKAEVSPAFIPTMVTFKDINDPLSVKLAYQVEFSTPSHNGSEYDIKDNIEMLFGEGTSLKSVTLEITEDKVTTGIKTLLSWLPEYQYKLLDGNTIHTIEAENRLANSLGSGSFAANTLKETK